MRKIISSLIIVVSILLSSLPPATVRAAETSELNIYAIYLDSNEKGDSVLLESKGHYLLIDIGATSNVLAVIRQLRTLGVTHVDILFSHLHKDHMGEATGNRLAGLNQFAISGITVDTMYLPSPSLTPFSQSYPGKYAAIESFMQSQGSGQIVYLTTGDHVSVGDADGAVVGPLSDLQTDPSTYAGTSSSLQAAYTLYENNRSLAVIFTCGNTRYFTAGDCSKDEAASLVARYGDSLKSDIMKLCHHGTGSGNSELLLDKVQPSYSFASNAGLDEPDIEDGLWQTYNSSQRAGKYGMVYLVGNERQTLIYHIENDNILLYQGSSIQTGKKMTGWQSLHGADGFQREYDMYYLDDNCTPLTGVQRIDGHSYYFKDGGQMDYGTYADSGAYSGWKTFPQGRRYFAFSEDDKYAYMCTGFKMIKNHLYYFDKEGFQLTHPTGDEIILTQIGSGCYAMDCDGTFLHDDWLYLEDGDYYFGKSGKMLQDCVRKIDGDYYYFTSDGTMAYAESRLLLQKVGTKTYAITSDGTLLTNRTITRNGHRYYFGSNGVMQTNKTVKLNGKTYYCNAKGIMKPKKK